jgi:hypothetical protein
MNKRIGLVVAGLAAAAVMAGGTAFAASSSSAGSNTSTIIYGCYDSGGNMKVALPLGTTTCPKGYSAIDWNQTGPAGAGATVTPITAGSGNSNCPNGGAEIQDGKNPPGTAYACNGTNGTDGTDGINGTSPTVTQLGPNSSNCPNGGAEIQDGNPADSPAYVCEAGVGQFTWTFSTASQGVYESAATSLPAGLVVTPIAISASGGCTDATNAIEIDSPDNILAYERWGGSLTTPSTTVYGPGTLSKAGTLHYIVYLTGAVCTNVSITFTFDETQQSSYN